MRDLILLTIAFVSVMMFTCCEESNDTIQKSMLEKGWTQSFEEKSSEGIEIYRPSDYRDFSISRYRQIFNFYENNICDYRVLAANDGHYMESGSWEFNGQTNIITIFNSKLEVLYEWEVIELKSKVLKMKAKN